ncbi:MAG: YggT family protein [Anaerolineaceae bacterium]|jgi:YggT family protein
MAIIIALIRTLSQILTFAIFIYVLLSLFLPVTNPIRALLAKILDPMLELVRRVIKPIGGFDLSPVILMGIIYLIEWLLVRLFTSLAG